VPDDAESRIAEILRDWGERPPSTDVIRQIFDLALPDISRTAKKLMRSERADHTLQPDALVSEVYLRLAQGVRVRLRGRSHFLAIAGRTMRRILIEHARKRGAKKRGGERTRVTLTGLSTSNGGVDLLELVDLLDRLEEVSREARKVCELRFFAGLDMDEIGEFLGMTRRTVQTRWKFAQMWLKHELFHDSARGGVPNRPH
jgi:RNA polymerase sigma factor (TIGR02999 family)